ncbi:MAG: hypothetical protein IH888_13440 [Planctomycetes bacterium]|nr:hypothetical protein [Planctomycetota bacterium]
MCWRLPVERVIESRRIGGGSPVEFDLGDVFCPSFDQLLTRLGPRLTLAGEVSYMSDHGGKRDHFAVIEVGGIFTPLIVPVTKLRRVCGSGLFIG